MRRYVWRGLEHPSMEVLTLAPRDDGADAHGTIVGVWDGEPFQLTYRVEYNLLGEVSRVAWDTGELVSREPGWWVDEEGRDRPEFQACRTVDIRQTPFTNTLAILYAELSTGMSLETPVIHIDGVRNDIQVAVQRYTALTWNPAGSRYRFESGSFISEIAVDADGIVVDYPGLFERIYPPPIRRSRKGVTV